MSTTDHAELRREQFEAEVVEMVLRRFGLGRFRSDVSQFSEQTLDLGHRLTAVAFHSLFPSFPIYFLTDVVTRLGEDFRISRIFGDATTTKLFRRYSDRKEDVLPRHKGKPFALVFPWPRLRSPMVLHNGPEHTEATKLQWTFRITPTRTNVMMMEELLPLLQTLEWEPTCGDIGG